MSDSESGVFDDDIYPASFSSYCSPVGRWLWVYLGSFINGVENNNEDVLVHYMHLLTFDNH